MSFKKNLVRFSALASLCAASAIAAPYYANKPWWIFTHIDFNASSGLAGHQSWATWTTPTGSAGTKYMIVYLDKKLSGAGQCYAVSIEDQGASETVDLRFWSPTNVSIDDDGPGGDRRPRARFWITAEYGLKISAYSNSYNNVDFGIYNYLLDATSAAACDDGVSPFYNQATNTLVRANTTAN